MPHVSITSGAPTVDVVGALASQPLGADLSALLGQVDGVEGPRSKAALIGAVLAQAETAPGSDEREVLDAFGSLPASVVESGLPEEAQDRFLDEVAAVISRILDAARKSDDLRQIAIVGAGALLRIADECPINPGQTRLSGILTALLLDSARGALVAGREFPAAA